MDQLNRIIETADNNPEQIEFADVMSAIDAHYRYQPCAFSNGGIENDAGSNEGSCKVFALGKLKGLSPATTLALFGRYYREDVLRNPQGQDHANIRSFIRNGWDGISFDGEPLTE